MATLGQDTLSWVKRLLESTERTAFAVPSDSSSVWTPPSQEVLERLDFLTRLYCQCNQIVELETKTMIRYVPGAAEASDRVRHSD